MFMFICLLNRSPGYINWSRVVHRARPLACTARCRDRPAIAWHRMATRTTRPKDARAGRMLAVEVGPELLQALRDESARREQPLAVLVRRLLANGLEQAREGGPAAPGRVTALEAELRALAARVATLELPPHATLPPPLPAIPEPPLRTDPAAPAPLDPLPDRRLTPAEAEGLRTVPELVEALGLATGSALTNWIAREAARRGGSAVGAVYRGHRLRGKGLLPGAQKPGWLFDRVAA
jgi:hypothetical protein